MKLIKKIISLTFVLALGLCSISNSIVSEAKTESAKLVSSIIPPESLILNADGSYGGSINQALYGIGAPKNGEYNVENSPYFMYNDFYNMSCTNDEYPLTIFNKFKSYQQTMQDSSAFACLVMVFNRLGLDVSNEYSELNLLNSYQSYHNTTVYNNGDSVDDVNLGAFIKSLNLSIEVDVHKIENFDSGDTFTRKQIIDNLKAGNYVLLRYQSANGFGWKVVIGYDEMGTDSVLDDIIIFADPFDSADHYQTGYSHVRFDNLLKWYKKVDVNCNITNENQSVIIKPNVQPDFIYANRDTTVKQTLYELHHILNADGSYGGTRDANAYGTISTKNGNRNRTFTTYYKINDYYNLGDENTRLLLKNYNTIQQTMASSCGICTTISVFKYYGEPITEIDEVNFYHYYEEVTGDSPSTRGSDTEHLLTAIKKKGYDGEQSYTTKNQTAKFQNYNEFKSFVVENLSKDRPIMICIAPRGGHYVTIIGFDDMGTDYIYDDAIIISDSSDCWDHYQDGYNTYSANHLFGMFTNGSHSRSQPYVVFYPKQTIVTLYIIIGACAVLVAGIVVGVIIYNKKIKKTK